MNGQFSAGLLAAIAIASTCVLAQQASAPSADPIYVEYDGFVKNADGTRTLSFGYFNMNGADVTIQPGPDNGFTPGSADRDQPVTFLTGRHRSACVIVVPPDFDGQLQWVVKSAGRTIETSTAHILDPLYELPEQQRDLAVAGLNEATAPRMRCANRAPVVSFTEGFSDRDRGMMRGREPRDDGDGRRGRGGRGGGQAETPAAASASAPATTSAEPTVKTKVGAKVELNGSVRDDDLPRENHKVTTTWKKVSGPGDVNFADAGNPRTTATFSAAGTYEIELDASDGQLTGSKKVTVVVA
jgi:K319L-like, PKD domain